MKGLEEGVERQVDGIQHLGRVNQRFPHQTGNTVSEQLRREQEEDGRAGVGGGRVVETLHGEHLRS